jgi:hypothetical protein
MALTKSSEYDFSQQVIGADIFVKLNCLKMRKIKTRGVQINMELIAVEHLVLMNEVKKLRYEIAMMKQLSSSIGFYSVYFKNLQKTKSNQKAFNYTNKLYKEFFGRVKYSSYNDFKLLLFRNHGRN